MVFYPSWLEPPHRRMPANPAGSIRGLPVHAGRLLVAICALFYQVQRHGETPHF
jgi:hypothetical protein